MDMEILKNDSEIMVQLENLYKTRRDEILSHMLKTDKTYKRLCQKRTDASILLKKAFNDDNNKHKLFESYSDAVYAQEIYELDVIYMQVLHDFLKLTREQLRE